METLLTIRIVAALDAMPDRPELVMDRADALRLVHACNRLAAYVDGHSDSWSKRDLALIEDMARGVIKETSNQ